MVDINRTLAIVTLKQPFVDWLNSLPDRGDIDWTEAASPASPTRPSTTNSQAALSPCGGL
jgi:hypothetical protein